MKSPFSQWHLSTAPRNLSLATLFVAALTLLSSAGALAASPTAGSGTVQWAYAGSSAQTSTGNIAFGNSSIQYQIHSFYAWSVIYTQTNVTSSTFMLEGQRTMVEQYYMQLCSPNCQSPVIKGNSTLSGWETDTAFVNLTSAGTIFVNGTTPVPAYALINASSASASNMTGTRTWQDSASPPGTVSPGGPVSIGNAPALGSGSSYATEASQGSLSVAFTPPLGLVPLTPVANEVWNSSSNYTASGAWVFSFHQEGGGFPANSGNHSGALNKTGNVTLYGQDWGQTRLNTGQLAWVQSIALRGPFRLWDGVFLIPAPAALWATGGLATSSGGATTVPPASGTSAGSSGRAPVAPPIELSVATGAIDEDLISGHLGFIAALSAFAPSDFSISPPATTPAPVTPPGPVVSVPIENSTGASAAFSTAETVADPGSGTVQAQPVSVSTAQALDHEWLTGGPSSLSLPPLVIAGVGLLSVVAFLLAVTEVRRRTQVANATFNSAYAAFREAVPRNGGASTSRKETQERAAKAQVGEGESDPLEALL